MTNEQMVAAALIDQHLEAIARQYGVLPRKGAASAFRSALSRLNLPGGFQQRGDVATTVLRALA